MIHQALCDAFCGDLSVTPVPIGYAVRTPYLKADGDYAGFISVVRRPATIFIVSRMTAVRSRT